MRTPAESSGAKDGIDDEFFGLNLSVTVAPPREPSPDLCNLLAVSGTRGGSRPVIGDTQARQRGLRRGRIRFRRGAKPLPRIRRFVLTLIVSSGDRSLP